MMTRPLSFASSITALPRVAALSMRLSGAWRRRTTVSGVPSSRDGPPGCENRPAWKIGNRRSSLRLDTPTRANPLGKNAWWRGGSASIRARTSEGAGGRIIWWKADSERRNLRLRLKPSGHLGTPSAGSGGKQGTFPERSAASKIREGARGTGSPWTRSRAAAAENAESCRTGRSLKEHRRSGVSNAPVPAREPLSGVACRMRQDVREGKRHEPPTCPVDPGDDDAHAWSPWPWSPGSGRGAPRTRWPALESRRAWADTTVPRDSDAPRHDASRHLAPRHDASQHDLPAQAEAETEAEEPAAATVAPLIPRLDAMLRPPEWHHALRRGPRGARRRRDRRGADQRAVQVVEQHRATLESRDVVRLRRDDSAHQTLDPGRSRVSNYRRSRPGSEVVDDFRDPLECPRSCARSCREARVSNEQRFLLVGEVAAGKRSNASSPADRFAHVASEAEPLRRGIEEAPDEPGARHAIDVDATPRHPRPARPFRNPAPTRGPTRQSPPEAFERGHSPARAPRRRRVDRARPLRAPLGPAERKCAWTVRRGRARGGGAHGAVERPGLVGDARYSAARRVGTPRSAAPRRANQEPSLADEGLAALLPDVGAIAVRSLEPLATRGQGKTELLGGTAPWRDRGGRGTCGDRGLRRDPMDEQQPGSGGHSRHIALAISICRLLSRRMVPRRTSHLFLRLP